MVFRGRQGSYSGSLTWILLLVVTLLVVVGVHPSPYPAYEDPLPYQISPEQMGGPGEVAPMGFNEQQQLPFADELDYGSSNPERFADIFYDKRSDSNRNLQQILRSFPLVVGGPSPGDRILPLSWSSLEEASLAQQGRGTGVSSSSYPKGATPTHLSYDEPRPKREAKRSRSPIEHYCINYIKFCPFR